MPITDRTRSPTAEGFVGDVFRWLDQVNADPRITGSAFRVAYTIGQAINRKTRVAIVDQKRLAARTSLHERMVRNLIDQLRDCGHLSVAPKHRYQASHYAMILRAEAIQPATDCRLDNKLNRQASAALHPPQPAISGRSTGKELPGSTQPHYQPHKQIQPQKGDEVSEAFERFWQSYPLKVGKLEARRRFDEALKQASADEIIAGAKRFARLKKGEETRFIKQPSTWLHEGCWLDEVPSDRVGWGSYGDPAL